MYQIIYESLSRQEKALGLLRQLLEEEYKTLLGRETHIIASLEFSIQELIRQIAVEKSLVIRSLDGKRVMDFAAALPEDKEETVRRLFESIDDGEQAVSRQASRNAQLSLALLDQSTTTLYALTKQITAPVSGIYGRHGDLRHQVRPAAALISGRL